MDDGFISILDEFLRDESDINISNIVNFRMEDILKCIRSHIERNLRDAEKEEDTTLVTLLLTKQAVLEKVIINNNNTLLHVVAQAGTVETAIRLLKCGADINAKNDIGKTPIFSAIQNSAEMVKVLLNYIKIDCWDLFRQALLHGTEEIVWLLIFESLLEIGNDSLKHIISTVYYELDKIQSTRILTKIFLQQEFHLQHMEESYALLIFFAARICRKDILHVSLEDCRKHLTRINRMEIENVSYEPSAVEALNVKGFSGVTALHHAVSNQLVKVARFLLKQGADPNCQTENNVTPLHFAAYFHDKEMCKLLLKFGANVNPNLVGLGNPLNLVCGDYETRALLRKEANLCSSKNEDLNETGSIFNLKIMKLLLKSGADPNSLSKQKLPALFDACLHYCMKAMGMLLKHGANINAVDNEGNSVMHCIGLGISVEEIDSLLDYFLLEDGYNIDSKTFYSNIVNESAFDMKNEKQSEIFYRIGRYLVTSRGADLHAINNQGEDNLLITIYSDLLLTFARLLGIKVDQPTFKIFETPIGEYNLSMYRKQKVLISYIALRESELNDNTKAYIALLPEILEEAYVYFQKHQLEVVKLRATTISENCKLSYFDFLTKDFLTKDFYRSVQIAKNSDLREFFNTSKCEEEFPCYEFLLKYRFQMVQKLENFVEKTFDFISNYTNLPPEMVVMIMRNLRAVDFHAFGNVLSNK